MGSSPRSRWDWSGSFSGGFLGYVTFHKGGDDGCVPAVGVLGSIIGVVIALAVYRAVTRPDLIGLVEDRARAGNPPGRP